ncbi:MAG TPA: hypothetical protein VF613_19905 [Longimicrobium sp.]|jgi:hypothetical protein
MSVTFTDDELITWEAYASGGRFGLPTRPKVVFNCLSDPGRRPRYVEFSGGDEAKAEELVHEYSDATLKQMLRESRELE